MLVELEHISWLFAWDKSNETNFSDMQTIASFRSAIYSEAIVVILTFWDSYFLGGAAKLTKIKTS